MPRQYTAANSHPQKPLPRWSLWWMGVRPRTLTMAAVPVVLGTLLAWTHGQSLAWGAMLVALVAALAIQAGTNLFNDARDGERGTDAPDRPGPPRLTASGLATALEVKRMAVTAFLIAFVCGLYLTAVGGWPILAIGIGALVAGWAYSGGNRPLSHTPWGEVFVLLFFGIAAVSGSYLLQTGVLNLAALLLGIVIGLPAAAVLLVNNVRDLETDCRAGRRTLAAVFGRDGARFLYATFMLLPFALLLTVPERSLFGFAWLAIPAFAWLVWRFFVSRPDAGMNQLLVRTAQAQVLLGLLVTADLVIGRAQ